MNAYPYPGFLSRTLPKRPLLVKLRKAAANKDWAMLKLVGWIATTATLSFLAWQTAAADPLWPRTVSALLLVIISVLAGIRVGADSAAAYTKDLHRLNKVLAEQNRGLQETNAMLLKRASSESAVPSKST